MRVSTSVAYERPPVDPPSVSVVIATYQYAHTIEQAIDSAFAQQTITPEVVVVDDGSTDGTDVLVAERYGDRVRYLSQANAGVCAARNRGVELATGDWVLFLDADNVLPEDHLVRLFEALERDPTAAYAYGDLYEFGAADVYRRMPEWDLERLKRGNYVDAGSLFPRDLLQRHRWDERFRHSYEDWDLVLRLAAAGHHGVRGDTAVRYRRHTENRSQIIDVGRAGQRRRWQNYARLYGTSWRTLGVTWPLSLMGRSARAAVNGWRARRHHPSRLDDRLELLVKHLAGRQGIDPGAIRRREPGTGREGAVFEVVCGGATPEALAVTEPDAEFVGWANGGDRRAPLAILRAVPPTRPTPESFRVLAIVPVRDESDLLEHTFAHLVAQGVEIHVVDNWSTEECQRVIERWRGRGVVGVDRFPAGGPDDQFDLPGMLRLVTSIGRASGADWIVYNDADELREAPWAGVGLRDALWHVQECGFNAVNLTQVDFLLTDPAVAARGLRPDDDLGLCFPRFSSPPVGDRFHVKLWQNGPAEVDIASSGGHVARFDGRRVFPYNFVMRHYPYRSAAQAQAKIEQRLSRMTDQDRRRGWGRHYTGVDTRFPLPPTAGLPWGTNPRQEYLVELLTAIGWRTEVEARSWKHAVARGMQRTGLWSLYQRVRGSGR